MVEKEIDKKELFDKLDKDGNGQVDRNEFRKFFFDYNLIHGITRHDVDKLYNYLDSNSDGSISIDEFCLFIESIRLDFDKRMNNFSDNFNQKLKA